MGKYTNWAEKKVIGKHFTSAYLLKPHPEK